MAIITLGLPANSIKAGRNSEGADSAIAVDASSNGEILLPSGQFAADASYLHQGDDLVLIGRDGATVVVDGYFLLNNPPDLVTPEGGRVTASMVGAFVLPEAAGQYAQAGQTAQTAVPIGQVKDISGQVFVVRVDGTRWTLTAGDPVYQGDVIETGVNGAVNLLFLDQTTFSLGDSARLALDEMVYNPETQSGSSSFSILKGVFVFVSGQIAQTDNTQMTVTTPVATIGIRGTTVAGDVKPAGAQSLFTVIDGEIAVITQGGTVVMTDQNATTFVTSFLAPPSEPIVFSPSQMNSNYGSVRKISNDYGRDGTLEGVAPDAGGGEGGGDGGEGDIPDPVRSLLRINPNPFREDEKIFDFTDASEGEGDIGDEAVGDDDDVIDDLAEGEGVLEEDNLSEGEGEGEGEGGGVVIGASGLPVSFDGSDSTEPQSFIGGESSEEITGGSANDSLAGVGGGDVINGGGGNDTLDGGPGADTLTGGAGDDTVTGGTGDDTIIAATGSGNDFYDGGADIDTAIYSSATSSVTIDLAAGTAIGDASVGFDQLTNIERVVGGSGNDVFFGSSGDDSFFGAGGDDTASGLVGDDFLVGDVGNDVLNGDSGNDILTGDDGNDFLAGGSGNDTVLGGAGDDILIGGAGTDTYDGGTGADTLSFTNTSSALTFDFFARTVSGDLVTTATFSGIERFEGGSGDDTFVSTAGVSAIDGGVGNDFIEHNASAAVLDGGPGSDTLTVTAANQDLTFGSGGPPITIDFENFTSGTTITAGTNIGGVTFNEDIFVAPISLFPASSGNQAARANPRFGDFSGTFDQPQDSFTIAVGDAGGDLDTNVLTGFNAAGQIVDQASFTGIAGQLLSIEGNGITSFTVDETGANVFDNLTFGGSGQGILNFETIDLGDANNTFTVDETDVLNNVEGNTLKFLGGASSNVNLSNEFSNDDSVIIDSIIFDQFFSGGGATILVQQGITANVLSSETLNINDSGTLTFGQSPGSLTIGGDFINEIYSTIEFELGGLAAGIHDGYDQLTVEGTFNADGALDIVEYEEFEVSVGDQFTIIRADDIDGNFDTINGLDVGGGVILDVAQTSTEVTLFGKSVTHQGTADGDTLTGTAGDDVFSGGDGGDLVLGGGGADLMHGDDGDDVFVMADTGFGRIDGGNGFDTVRFEGTGQGFDLTRLRGDQLNAIEAIDIGGFGDNTLTLDADTAFSATRGQNALTGIEHSLIVDGDTGDTVEAGAGWSNTGSVTIGSNGYSVYESATNGAQIYVDDDINVNAA